MLSSETRDRIQTQVAAYPERRTALLPALKLAQDEVRYLPPEAVAEVSDLAGVSHAAAQELTTFYSMLRTAPSGKVRIEVCAQLPCALAGGERLLHELAARLGIAPGETCSDGEVTLVRTVECFGACHRAPMCRVNDQYAEHLGSTETVEQLVEAVRTADEGRRTKDEGCSVCPPHLPSVLRPSSDYQPVLLPHLGRTTPVSLEEYRAASGYRGLERAVKELSPEQVVDEVKAAGLRGRGGANFPTGLKWGFVPKIAGPKYLCCNADESEPGTFKDRELMEIEPHMVLEGVAICCYAIGSNEAFIYVRGEYVEAADRLEAAIAEADQAGLHGKNLLGSGFDLKVHVFRGAGAYICGEETALLESLEGRRPMPRSRPPFPAVEGLYGRPTVVNNVETLANVPHILARGSAWYSSIGQPPNSTGPKIFCLSGCVNRPGNYELPLGLLTFRQLIDDYGGGVPGGLKVKGVLPAGISAPILPAEELDTKLDYESVAAAGSMLGSASLVVLDERVCMVRAAARMLEFFRHESCGKCTPCREGTAWLHKILVRLEDGRGSGSDLDLLLSISGEIGGKVLCALGDFAISPVTSTVRLFRDEYVEHFRLGRCPYPAWSER
jgi:NADH-quinone oxidoreductase subunit F